MDKCSNCQNDSEMMFHADRDSLLCERCYEDFCAQQERDFQEHLQTERMEAQEAFDQYELGGEG